VWIENREYRLESATARRVITINPDPKVGYSFIRVEGDSMIEAVPNPIMNGDYVLVWITPVPDNERIVVATYRDPQTGDVTGAVKLKRSDGLHSKNSTKNYPVVPLETVKSYVGEVIAIAKPCAQN
jgi:SOS-response transcriptional repressor LexA